MSIYSSLLYSYNPIELRNSEPCMLKYSHEREANYHFLFHLSRVTVIYLGKQNPR